MSSVILSVLAHLLGAVLRILCPFWERKPAFAAGSHLHLLPACRICGSDGLLSFLSLACLPKPPVC